MSKILVKNMKFNFDKDGDHIKNIRASLIWDSSNLTKNVLPGRKSPKFDADLSAAMLQVVGKDENDSPVLNIYANDEAYLVYYGNIEKPNTTYTTPDGEITHNGDCRSGKEGEDIIIHLDLVPDQVDEIPIVGTIHRAIEKKQNWGLVNAKLIVENLDTDEVLVEYDLSVDVANSTAIHVCSFYRDEEGKWEIQAMGIGYETGTLEDFVNVWTKKPVKSV